MQQKENEKPMSKHFNIISYRWAIIAMLCLVSLNSYAQRRKPVVVIKIDSTEIVLNQTKGSPIAPFKDTLFLIHGNIGSFTVEQRATAIEDKIKLLEQYKNFNPDSLQLVAFNDQINLIYNDAEMQDAKTILSIDTLQAQIYGRSKIDLANSYRNQIISSITQQQEAGSWKRIAINALSIIAIVVAEYFVVRFVRFIYRRLRVATRLQRHKKIKGFLGIVDAEREEQIIFILLKVLRVLLLLVSVFVCILLLLRMFPNTSYLSDQLLEYVVSPLKKIGHSVIDYLPKLVTIIIIITLFYYIKKFLLSITNKIGESKITFKGFYPDWAKPTYNIVSGILFVFMFILIFPYLPNSNSQTFQGVSVFVGVIVSLGSTNVIGNLIAGLVITYMRPFRTGDRVKMDDTIGNIIEKTALVTRIRTPKNEIITIPNSSVMSTKTINYTSSANEYGLILFINVTIGYEEPWRKIHELLQKAAVTTPNISSKQKPFILQTAFDDFYVEYQLNVVTKDANRMNDIYSDLRKNVQDVFNEAGVQILSPHYRINKNIDEPDEAV